MSDPTPIGRVLDRLTDNFVPAETGEAQPAPVSEDERDRRMAIVAALDACIERFPTRYKHATILDLDAIPEIRTWADEFRADPTGARSLLLLGGTGSGKTHAAYGALKHAVCEPKMSRARMYRTPRWKALTHADLMASLRPRAVKDADAETILTSYQETDLLFIDDLGAIKATEFVEEMTYRLINGRYEAMRPNIVTSNLPLMELKDAIGDRIASRLAQDSVRVALTTPDRRRQRAA